MCDVSGYRRLGACGRLKRYLVQISLNQDIMVWHFGRDPLFIQRQLTFPSVTPCELNLEGQQHSVIQKNKWIRCKLMLQIGNIAVSNAIREPKRTYNGILILLAYGI